jgi:predicted transcriptional regulator
MLQKIRQLNEERGKLIDQARALASGPQSPEIAAQVEAILTDEGKLEAEVKRCERILAAQATIAERDEIKAGIEDKSVGQVVDEKERVKALYNSAFRKYARNQRLTDDESAVLDGHRVDIQGATTPQTTTTTGGSCSCYATATRIALRCGATAASACGIWRR